LNILQNDRPGEPKKVIMLFSMSFLPHQGRYLRVYNEARTLVADGKDVNLIAWDRNCEEPPLEVIDGIKVERIRSKSGFQRGPVNVFGVLKFYVRLLPRLFKKNADLIHCFNLDTIIPGLIVAKFKGQKTVLDLCEPEYYAYWPQIFRPLVRIFQIFERFFSKRFDYVLVHNRYQLRKFRGYGLSTIAQIGSHPNRSLIVERVKENAGSDHTVTIGRFGSIYKNNGIEEMIDAFKELKAVFPGIGLMLAGKVFEEFQEEFEYLITPLGDSVNVSGEFSPADLPGLYDQIDISLQLLRKTQWFQNITPTKFFESLANGVPVVTSDIGDLREIIEEYRCGVIVDETDPASIFAGLKGLIEDPDLRLKMAHNALRAIREKYNWDLMGQRMLNIYRTLGSPGASNPHT